MEHLGWFFAGTSLGLFVGVFLVSLAKIAGLSEQEMLLRAEEPIGHRKLVIMRR